MRSCSSAATAARSSAFIGLAALSKPLFSMSANSVTRSTRCRPVSPQLRAMSLALLAHGDTVPRRGITTTRSPPAVTAATVHGSP